MASDGGVGVFPLLIAVAGGVYVMLSIFNPWGLAERFFEWGKGVWGFGYYPKKLSTFRVMLGVWGFVVLIVGTAFAVWDALTTWEPAGH